MASSPEPSPPKPGSALSAKLQNATKEDLEKMLLDSFRKLKQRDQKIAKLQQAQDESQAQAGSSGADSGAEQRAAEAEAECKSLRTYLETADSRLQDSLEENSTLQEQLQSLKHTLRSLASSKDELHDAQTQLQQAAAAADDHQKEISKLRAENANLQEQHAETQKLLQESQGRLQEALSQLDAQQDASAELETLKASVDAGKQELQQASRSLSEQRQQSNTLGKRLRQQMSQARLSHCMESMRHLHAGLIGQGHACPPALIMEQVTCHQGSQECTCTSQPESAVLLLIMLPPIACCIRTSISWRTAISRTSLDKACSMTSGLPLQMMLRRDTHSSSL